MPLAVRRMLRSSTRGATTMRAVVALRHRVAARGAQRAFSLTSPVQWQKAKPSSSTQDDDDGPSANILDKDELKLMSNMEKQVRAVLDAQVKPKPFTPEEEAEIEAVRSEYAEKSKAYTEDMNQKHINMWLSMQRAFVALPESLKEKADRPDLRFTAAPRLWMTTPPYKCYIERDLSLVDDRTDGERRTATREDAEDDE